MIGLAELETILASTAFAGRSATEVVIQDSGQEALVFDCAPSEGHPAWLLFRSLVDQTGRWPVFMCDWGGTSVASGVFEHFPAPGERRSRDRIDRLSYADSLSIESALDQLSGEARPAFEDAWFAQDALKQTAAQIGVAPTLDALRDSIGLDATEIDLEFWLLQWEQSQGNVDSNDVDSGHLEWFSPPEPCALVLLPTARPWETLGYLRFWGANGAGDPERAVAVLRSWHDRFGAELWSNFDTMLEFVVPRPPSTIAEAWGLAVEQYRFGPSTLILPGVSIRNHARALIDRPEWHIHERP